MSIATGRTPRASEVLELPPGVQIAIPLVCFMEAHSAFKRVKEAKLKLKDPFPREISDIGRDPDINAQLFAKALAGAESALTDYLEQSQQRLVEAIRHLASRARLVSSRPAVLQRAHSYLPDPTDDMIVASIIQDAKEDPHSRMAFFSEDEKLERPTLMVAMQQAGVTMLNGIDACLAWCAA
jgi:hypothetical protein